jgi:hypothetical protein
LWEAIDFTRFPQRNAFTFLEGDIDPVLTDNVTAEAAVAGELLRAVPGTAQIFKEPA